MNINKKLHVHFMGIGGSGCASIAMLAHAEGYRVSGCDQNTESYYARELKKLDIQIYQGHSEEHLKNDVDIVAVSPAIFDISPDNPELLEAKSKGILMTWQEFMGRFLQKDKRVIAISGTHGKTTTTFLTGELLIDAGLEPTVMGGSVYKKWGSGGRSGSSDIFVCEADEFNRNFHNYRPEIAVMNNVEMDHPECYNSFEEVLESFTKFVCDGGRLKKLILNGDSEGAVEVLGRLALRATAQETAEKTAEKTAVASTKDAKAGNAASTKDAEGGNAASTKDAKAGNAALLKDVEVYVFSRENPMHECGEELNLNDLPVTLHRVLYRTTKKDETGTSFTFSLDGTKHAFSMALYGEYNVSNAVVAALISLMLGVSDAQIQDSLMKFSGVGRRFDRVGLMKNVPVFDDYAHHPTEIASVLGMVKEYFPDRKAAVVFEPHQVSRLRLMLPQYAEALMIADRIVIAKTHLGREIHKDVHPITPEEWTSISDKFYYEEDNEKIRDYVSRLIDDGECGIIIVIGAANSYKISQLMVND